MGYISEPKYDGDLVNKAYVDKLLGSMNIALNQLDYNKNFGAQPNPPYRINDTWMNGNDLYICIVERLIGEFDINDWDLATNYVDNDTAFQIAKTYTDSEIINLNDTIGILIDNIQDQLDGKIYTWFGEGVPTLENEPAVNWTTAEEKDNHRGDIYYDSLTGKGYRFSYIDNNYTWFELTDTETAAALELANEAKELAQQKRRIFVVQPYPPYDVGDLWTLGLNGGLYRCKTAKQTGLFESAHWELATNYDHTQTVIDGGLITTGTIQVIQGGSATAGMTGNTSGDNSIRFWAGSTFANRANAPFRVTQGGQLVATNAIISGNVDAGSITSGTLPAARIGSGAITEAKVATNAITADKILSGAITGVKIADGTITATKISAGTITGDKISSSTIITAGSGHNIGGIGVSGDWRMWAGNSNPSSAPFRVRQDGEIYATRANLLSGCTVGGFSIGSVSLSGWNPQGTMLLQRGSNASVDFPANGGRLMLASTGSGGAALTSANELCIADTYGWIGSGEAGFKIGIRAGYGGIRIITSDNGSHLKFAAQNGTTIKSYMTIGNNISIYGNNFANLTARDTSSASASNVYVGARQHITLGAGKGVTGYLFGHSTGHSNSRIQTSAGSASSKNVKKGIKNFNKKKYNDALDVLKQLNLCSYDYTYDLYENRKQFGFIIDELLEIPNHEQFFDIHEEEAYVDGEHLDFQINEDDDSSKEKIKVKMYNPEALDKYLLTVCKAQQEKIDKLEDRLNKELKK